jgi:hypothetical protein
VLTIQKSTHNWFYNGEAAVFAPNRWIKTYNMIQEFETKKNCWEKYNKMGGKFSTYVMIVKIFFHGSGTS